MVTQNRAYQVSLDDLKFCLPGPFNLAFTTEKVLKAWRNDGVDGYGDLDRCGFTRTPYWSAVSREAEAARQMTIQQNRGRLQALTPNNGGLGGGHRWVPGLEGLGAEGAEGDDDDDGDDADAERAAAREEAEATKPGLMKITQHSCSTPPRPSRALSHRGASVI